MPIRQITIVGTGLIGGSLALALRNHGFAGTIVGCDKPSVLEAALEHKAIDRAETELEQAVVGSDVIVFATPVGCILSQFETIAPTLPPTTLITDTGSTKQKFVERARMIFGAETGKRVLPGHPMAGKEFGGIEHADAHLFQDAVWLITPIVADQQYTPLQEEFTALLASIGARIIVLDPERHDLLCAWISHLPQMISTALTSVLHEELGEDEAVTQIGGRALREMTRIGHSPYSMWRDIALTNTENLEAVMLRFEQQMTHLRENLRGPGLREMFEGAHRFGRERPKGMKEGDLIRVLRVPQAVKDSTDFTTKTTLEYCVGRVFPIMGFQGELIQIDVGEVVGKPPYMESIWIEPYCVEKANDREE